MKNRSSLKQRSAPRGKQRGIFINPWCFKQKVGVHVKSVMLVSCDDIITLSATISGNVVNRTFEWVQNTGATVNWLEDRYQTDVTFQQPVVRDDKIFTFYMDRGLSTEVRKEILITTAMVEHVSHIVKTATSAAATMLSDEVASAGYFAPISPLYGTTTLNDPQKSFYWVNPSVYYFAKNEIIETASSGTVTSIDVGKANYYVNVNNAALYKIKTTVDYYGVMREAISTDYAVPSTVDRHEVAASDVISLNPSSIDSSFSVLEVMTRELITETSVSDEYALMWNLRSDSSFSVLEVMTRELITETSASDEYALMWNLRSDSSFSVLEVKDLTLTTLG